MHAALADARLQLGGRAGGDGAAAAEHDDLVREAVGLLEVLGREQERGAARDELGDRLPHLGPAGRVEPGRRLVEEHDRPVHDQARGEVEPAAHAAGVGADLAVGGVGDPEALEQRVGARERLLARDLLQPREQAQVLAAGQAVVERGLLAGEGEAGARGRGLAHDVMACDERAAGGGGEQRREDPHGGRLAGAVVAQQAEHGARFDDEIQAAQGLGGAEGAPQVFGSYSVRHSTPYDSGTLYECQSLRYGRGMSRAGAARTARCRARRSSRVAIEVADAEGLEAVSMRRIARDLRAGAMSLYHYFDSRDELLELMGDTVAEEMLVPSLPPDWRPALEAIAQRSRAMFLRHPWLLATLHEQPLVTPNLLRHIEQSAQSVSGLTGVDPDLLTGIVTAVDDYTIGYTMRELGGAGRGSAAASTSPRSAT